MLEMVSTTTKPTLRALRVGILEPCGMEHRHLLNQLLMQVGLGDLQPETYRMFLDDSPPRELVLNPPEVLVTLGDEALACISAEKRLHDWRGSPFRTKILNKDVIVIPTHRPERLLKMYSDSFLVRVDLAKAAEFGKGTPYPPERDIEAEFFSIDPLLDRIEKVRQKGQAIAIDVEGYPDAMQCCSVATSPTEAFIIPFASKGGKSCWSEQEELLLTEAFIGLMTDEKVPKILQNSLYDRFVISWTYGILVKGVVDDTMVAAWEHLSELPKRLGVLTSVYTLWSFHKDGISAENQKEFFTYCCLDSTVTFDIRNRLQVLLQGREESWNHYRFNMELLNPLLYMELRGIALNATLRNYRISQLEKEVAEKQDGLSKALGFNLNVNSPKQMVDYLYKKKGLPPRFNRNGGMTADFSALMSLGRRFPGHHIDKIIEIRSVRKRLSDIESCAPDKRDGRIRCSYNVVGTVSGRLSCSRSATGAGTNLQTIPERDRDLFIPDEGYFIFNLDLSGADGWTVAANAAACGDGTMMNDLKAGLKIPKILAAMDEFGPTKVSEAELEELIEMCNAIPKTDPRYFAFKCVQHGSNYGMKKVLLAQTVFDQSEGKVVISAAEAESYQKVYFTRYPGVLAWHRKVQAQLSSKRYMVSASGHRRAFLGRPADAATLREALANEPQENTTFATNLAAWRLWRDPENRRRDGSLIVEPLHQVHDSIIGQFPKDQVDFATRKLCEWFDNELVIAGIPLRIPFEGGYGDNWKDTDNPIKPNL